MNEKLKKLLFPPLWVLLLLTVAAATGLVLVFVKGLEQHWSAYAVYVLSFYTLCVDVLFCSLVLPKTWKSIKEKLYSNKLTRRYMTDKVFKTHVNLFASLLINMIYVGVHVVSWVLYHSAWFWIMAVYYGILAIMRYLVARYIHQKKVGADLVGEWKRARLCAWILLLINFVLTGAVMMILYQHKGAVYGGILIYVMAAYTFYMTTMAIINIFKYRKLGSPILNTARVISLTSALVSMLSLETAMFASFGGEMSLGDQRLMIALTGGGISLVVIFMAVMILVNAKKEIKELKNG